MKQLMPFDEINRLEDELILSTFEVDGVRRSRKDKHECIDEVFELLCLAYLEGTEAVAKEFGIDIDFFGLGHQMNQSVFKQFNGKDFRDRVGEYYDAGDYESINRVIETETHRIYNDAVLNAANIVRDTKTAETGEKPVIMKRWKTMLDERVRDTHDYLEGRTVPLDELFFTFDGDSAMYPGGFENPENNINCRCGIDITSA